MYSVHYWEAHPNGITAYINKLEFLDYWEAMAFRKRVNGVIKSNWRLPK